MEDKNRIIDTFGIILNKVNFSDYDQILTILTPGIGKISAMAKGSRKKGNIQTEIMTFSKFTLFRGKTMYHINNIDMIESFYNIYTDYDSMVSALDIIKFTNQIIKEESNYIVLTLLLNALQNIDQNEKSPNCINVVYKIKLLQLVGFKLNLDNIEKSGKKIFLKDVLIDIDEPIFKILEYIISSDEKKVFKFKTTNKNISKLQDFFDKYIEYIL